ncbi:MAG: hypothetical protein IPP40_12020 [bacterium]|nr:hypothetical protein [bacterium]
MLPNSTVRVVRISSDGETLWDNSLSTGQFDYSSSISACSDNLNGAYFVWTNRAVSSDSTRGYTQRINPAGQRLWGDTGRLILDVAGQLEGFSCSADQLGNVTIAWEWYLNGEEDIYAQRIGANGGIQWAENGIALTEAIYDQYNPQVLP